MTLYRLPGPRRHPERDLEDQLLSYFVGRGDIKEIGRQVRIPGAGIADIVLYAEIDDEEKEDGKSRLIVVVEVKAQRAGAKALMQLNRYLAGLQAYFGDDCKPITWAGAIAAPSFDPRLEAYAADESNTFGIFRMGRTA